MEYQVLCQCGKTIPVKTDDSGTTIRCACGQGVAVPSLSRLRAAAGLNSYESGTIDTIRRMLAEGTLPWGETCAESGWPTKDVIELAVQCERFYAPQDRYLVAVFASLLVGFWMAILALGAGNVRSIMAGTQS